MKFTATEISKMEEVGILQFLDTLAVTKKYKAEKLNKFIVEVVSKMREVNKSREEHVMSLIEKYGTAEEIEAKKMEQDSPHYETANAELATFMESWGKAEVEIETDIDVKFFDNGICWTANNVRNQLMINEVFGRA